MIELSDKEVMALAVDLRDLLDSPNKIGLKYDNNALESKFEYQTRVSNNTVFIHLQEEGFTPNSDIKFIVTSGDKTHTFRAFVSIEGIVILEGTEYALFEWFTLPLMKVNATIIIENNTYEIEI